MTVATFEDKHFLLRGNNLARFIQATILPKAEMDHYHFLDTLRENDVHLQRERITVIPTSIKKNYQGEFEPGTREIVQNWRDRCFELCPSFKIVSGIVDGLNEDDDYDSFYEYEIACLNGVVYGVLLNNDKLCWALNCSTSLHTKCLLLGPSGKKTQVGLAGKFGEGFKLEINKLKSKNCSVLYKTGNSLWDFKYIMQDEEQILAVESTKVGYSPHLVVCVEFTKKFINPHDVANYLLLQHDYDCVDHPYMEGNNNSGIEVLLEEDHCSKIFVNGIFVKRDDAFFPNIGINYKGCKKQYDKLGFTGRRTHIYSSKFSPWLLDCWFHKRDTEEGLTLAEKYYDMLENHPSSTLSMAWDTNICHKKEFTNELVKLFLSMYGKNAVPVENDNDGKEAKEYKLKPVQLVQSFVKILKKSEECNTKDRFYANMVNDFIANESYVESPLSFELKRDLFAIYSFLNDNNLKFTNYDLTRPIIYIKQQRIYVVSTKSLNIATIHTKEGFRECTGECFCMSFSLFKDFYTIGKEFGKEFDFINYQKYTMAKVNQLKRPNSQENCPQPKKVCTSSKEDLEKILVKSKILHQLIDAGIDKVQAAQIAELNVT